MTNHALRLRNRDGCAPLFARQRVVPGSGFAGEFHCRYDSCSFEKFVVQVCSAWTSAQNGLIRFPSGSRISEIEIPASLIFLKKTLARPDCRVTLILFWGEQKPVATLVATGFNFFIAASFLEISAG